MVEQIVMEVLLPIIATIATALVPILLNAGARYLKTKTDNEKVHAALDQFNDLVYTTVMELEQTVRVALSDGKLTQEEKDKIKAIAMSKVKGQLPEFMGNQLKTVVHDLDDYISSKIEAYVSEMKQTG